MKGIASSSEQISILVSVCMQEFQLQPNFVWEKIDEGRFQHLCKVDFQGVFISKGKGHNKQEAKKDAASNAIKIVAPNIYKEVLADMNGQTNSHEVTSPHKNAP